MSSTTKKTEKHTKVIDLDDAVNFESWEYQDADTQHLTHNIHRYSGKFIPQIASRAISILSQPGELIVDPYCGSGTTLVECALLGRRGLGFDLSPLAVLVASSKVTPFPSKSLDRMRDSIRHHLMERSGEDQLPLFGATSNSLEKQVASDPRLQEEWYQKWFKPTILVDLITIDLAIKKIKDQHLQNLAKVAFSDILRKSSNAHSGYPNVMFDKNSRAKSSPIRPFLKSLDRVCDMVSLLNETKCKWDDVRIARGNACSLPIDDCTVDAVVTHPPYIGSIPYAEYGALSLKWLGFDPKQLDLELTGGRRQSPKVVDRFREGYGKMLEESSRVLKSGKHAFLMVGNPVVRGEMVDLAEMTIDLASQANLNLVSRTLRNGVNRRANKMGAEHLLFFKKISKKKIVRKVGSKTGSGD